MAQPTTRRGSARLAVALATALAAALTVTILTASCASSAGGRRAGASGSGGRSGAARSSPGRPGARHRPSPTRTPGAAQAPSSLTSCHAVAHFGDSTSDGLVSADYLPDPAQRINAQYTRVGVTVQRYEISAGTSIVETVHGEANAYDTARQVAEGGYRGCWVLALGTNDTADVAVGSNAGVSERIRRMMSVANGDPVLWVNVTSLVTSGPYAETNMRAWNDALVRACASYPNMRIFDWASVANPGGAKAGWFLPDGIHYTPAGYGPRARLIANALARAFPRDHASSPGCVVP
jgi:lysophospholipase L1-like esterase